MATGTDLLAAQEFDFSAAALACALRDDAVSAGVINLAATLVRVPCETLQQSLQAELYTDVSYDLCLAISARAV